MNGSCRHRVGLGFDVHPFRTDRPLVLGGVTLRETQGLDGHSDADAVIHALCDALLGASGLDDIGHQFPDTDEQYRGIESARLLEQVMDRLRASGYRPVNVDVTIVAQLPRMAPHFPAMRAVLAPILSVDPSCIGLKATTNERMQSWGHDEGIAAMATCLIERAEECPDT